MLGAVYGVAQILQTEGLARTPASVSGFTTGTYVVLTPVLGPVLRIGSADDLGRRRAVHRRARGALAERRPVATARLLILASAVLYALHIIGLGLWS